MTYSRESAPNGQGVATPAQIQAWFESRAVWGARVVSLPQTPIPADLGQSLYDAANAVGANSDLFAAQAMHESAAAQSFIARTKRNYHGIGAENDDPTGKSNAFATTLAGCRAAAAHWADYTRGEGSWTVDDPRAGAMSPVDFGVVDALWKFEQRWAWTKPAVYDATPLEARYGAMVAAAANALLAFAEARPDGDAGAPPRPEWSVVDGITNVDGYDHARDVRGVVNHIMVGSVAGTISWFRNPASKVSSNWGIGKDGRIYLFADPRLHSAWTNGVLLKPDMSNPLVQRWAAQGINPNTETDSIEHEGADGDIFTDAQIAANNRLTAWSAYSFGFAVSRDTILGHYQIDSVNKAFCPGQPQAVWTRLVDGALDILSRHPQAAPPASNAYYRYFDATGHGIGGGFRGFWEANGGLAIFGYPLSEEFTDARGVTVQWFERARFEWQPKLANNPYGVTLGLLGAESNLRATEAQAHPDAFRPR